MTRRSFCLSLAALVAAPAAWAIDPAHEAQAALSAALAKLDRERSAVPTPAPKPAPTPGTDPVEPDPAAPAPSVKNCPCSDRCACGCNAGRPCVCGNPPLSAFGAQPTRSGTVITVPCKGGRCPK